MTHHAAGIGTCTQSDMTIPSYPSSEMHLGKSPDHTEFQSWIVNFRTEVCSKAKNIPHAPCSGSRKSKQPNRWMTSTLQKSITGKDFPDCEELDLMMASALKRCCDKQTHFRKKISVEEQRAQKDNRFLRGRQIACLISDFFDLLDLMMKFYDYRGCSVKNWTTTTLRILIYVGSQLFDSKVVLHRTKF